MMVLTHLILNDMMKIRGEISEIALLLEDPDNKIQNIVKLFFQELNKKDNKMIYNFLPEAITRLSRQDQTQLGAKISENSFEVFAKNIMPYLEKDKFSENLVDKLCLRFTDSDSNPHALHLHSGRLAHAPRITCHTPPTRTRCSSWGQAKWKGAAADRI